MSTVDYDWSLLAPILTQALAIVAAVTTTIMTIAVTRFIRDERRHSHTQVIKQLGDHGGTAAVEAIRALSRSWPTTPEPQGPTEEPEPETSDEGILICNRL